MTAPTVTVELDLTGSPFGTAFSGTDVSAAALAGGTASPITVTWGRQDQYSQVTPTSVAGVFNDATGDYTPGKTSGTHYPYIRRGLHRRVAVTANATTVNVSDDFATTLEVVPSTDLWTTNISGSDILARYGGTQSSDDPNQRIPGTTLRSMLAEEMLLDSPSALYMLQEADGSTTFADVTGNNSPATVVDSKYGAGNVDAGQQPTVTWYGGNVVQFTNGDFGTWTSGTAAKGSGLQFISPDLSGGTSLTVEAWAQVDSTPTGNAWIFGNTSCGLAVQGGTGDLLFYGPSASMNSSVSICDGEMHHLAGTVSGTTYTVYVDGVSVGSGGIGPSHAGPGPTVSSVGLLNGATAPSDPLTGGVGYGAMYSTALSSTRLLDHFNAGNNACSGDMTDARITRLLSYRPNYGTVLDTGLGTMGFQDIQGRSLTDCLLEVGQVEGGVVFVDGLGRVNFRSRSRLFNPAVTVTLDCLAGDVSFGGNFREDTQNVLNDVTVSGSSGAAQRYYDAASIDQDGEFSISISLPIQLDTAALDMAAWMVANGTLEQVTIDSLTVNLLTCPAATAAAVLALQPMDVIQVTNIDVNATRAPATTMTFMVQGGSLSLAMDAMTATLNLTPAPGSGGGVTTAIWDDAATPWDGTAVWAF